MLGCRMGVLWRVVVVDGASAFVDNCEAGWVTRGFRESGRDVGNDERAIAELRALALRLPAADTAVGDLVNAAADAAVRVLVERDEARAEVAVLHRLLVDRSGAFS